MKRWLNEVLADGRAALFFDHYRRAYQVGGQGGGKVGKAGGERSFQVGVTGLALLCCWAAAIFSSSSSPHGGGRAPLT